MAFRCASPAERCVRPVNQQVNTESFGQGREGCLRLSAPAAEKTRTCGAQYRLRLSVVVLPQLSLKSLSKALWLVYSCKQQAVVKRFGLCGDDPVAL